ncbi:hypothetical protein TcasGA2_TC034715 [Tribolium castaneum]|uniref:Uncharacterized protein n=1 Tax=Tribolium castaneum TaxID=7070 RepID=A0A139WGW6_TRICA|nr:hypothetical protein TcasGA2_TC034715 [Tribolium castaneum]
MNFFKIIFVVIVIILCASDAKIRKKNTKGLILRQKETNAINFLRLAIMRLVYGVATRLGFGEQIAVALNGAFVPPGVDDYDYGGDDYGILDRDDDYDY